jgi:hypothetical protein
MRFFQPILIVIFAAGLQAHAAHRLTKKDVSMLVSNVPEALATKRRGGCLAQDYSELGPDLAFVQLRNSCPRSGSGFVGNYVVDLYSGRVWSDIDRTKEVDSPHLRAIRRKIVASR